MSIAKGVQKEPMVREYFGTDGIRGRVGKMPITPDFVMRLGHAAGLVLAHEAHLPGTDRPAVLIGKDTRVSGYMLEAALEAGFSAAGVDVCLVGPLPTPGIAYLTRALRLQAGVVISASHNVYSDNGIKFFSSDGTKLSDAVEQAIEATIAAGEGSPITCASPISMGRARRIDDAAGRYIEFCKSSFPNTFDLRGLKIAVDCAHGAAYQVAPDVFHELGAEVISIGVQPDGTNINADCGATSPSALKTAVVEHGADLGIAFDGDGDRVVMSDFAGHVYDGDQLLYIIAKGQLNVNGVVGSQMSNMALEKALGRLGIPLARAEVGDRYVLELLREYGWKHGGEPSGHLICLEKHSTGDGIIAALQVLKTLRETNSTLHDFSSELTLYPQRLRSIKTGSGFTWRDNTRIKQCISECERQLAGNGRVLIRPSGTEPVLRVMVEGRDASLVDRLATELVVVVSEENDKAFANNSH